MALKSLSPQRLSETSARHPWRTLLAWVVVLVAVFMIGNTFAGPTTGEGSGFTTNPDSQAGTELIEQYFGKDESSAETIVIHSDTYTVDDPEFRAVVDTTVANLQPWHNEIASITNYYDRHAQGVPEADQLVSADRNSLIMPIDLVGDDSAYEENWNEWVDAAQASHTSDVEVYTVGDLSSNVFGTIAEEDMSKDISIGLPVAGIVLLIVFGVLLAPVLPLAIGVVAIAVTSGLVLLLANLLVLDSTTMSLVSMIGLAVGIDYALFFLERFREERRSGALKMDAISRSGASAGKSIILSGATVIFALCGLLLMPMNFFQAMGISAAIVVVMAVAAAMTLLPALVRLLGDWANVPRFGIMGKLKRQDATGYREFETKVGTGVWGHLASAVMRRPVVWGLASLAILLACAAPIFTINLGSQASSTLPETDYRHGYDFLAEDFSAGMESPVQIVIEGDANDPTTKSEIAAFTIAIQGDDRFGPNTTQVSPDNGLTLVEVTTKADSYDKDAEEAVNDLRDNVIPATFHERQNDVYVTGATAETIDFDTALLDTLPRVFAFVLGLSFILLMVAFRSILVPFTSIILNMLSVGAAYGAVVAVFQHGFMADALGLTQVDTITSWLPVMLFRILFGLSMDYHVFLLSRVREHFDHTGDNDEAVRVGLQQTGRLITGAALIMVAVFGSFAGGRLVEMQQMGFGLAFAVLIDATLIRTILVPSILKLCGNANWYFPRWLRRLPNIQVEGNFEPIRLPKKPAVWAPVNAPHFGQESGAIGE